METKKSLRLLLFKECNRNCPGCCNKDWDLDNLPICTDYTPYNLIMLTGGEPMLKPDIVLRAIHEIHLQTSAPIVLYTAMQHFLPSILPHLNGVTLTLHTKDDVDLFTSRIHMYTPFKNKSLRLNIFREAGEILYAEGWKIKNGIKWIKNCPLPPNEVFMRYQTLI